MLRLWELSFEISRTSGISIHIQIAKIISQAITQGRLTAGTALPGSRILAQRIHVNRKTVVEAYDALIVEGWLTTQLKRGTFVAADLPTHHTKKLTASSHLQTDAVTFIMPTNVSSQKVVDNVHNVSGDLNIRASTDAHFFSQQPIVSLQQKYQANHLSNQDAGNVSAGMPDRRLMPHKVISRAMRHAFINYTRQKSNPQQMPTGLPALREALANMLNITRALQIDYTQICVLPNNQAAIFMIAKQLVKTGDGVVVEQLGNPLARQAFTDCGAHIFDVAHHQDGMDLTHLALLCQQQRIRAVYIAPNHQIPTTVSMSKAKKGQLLKLAALYDFFIIEDDSDSTFYFANHALSKVCSHNNQELTEIHAKHVPIASLDTTRVILVGGFSQVLGDAFSLSYVVGAPKLIAACGATLLNFGLNTQIPLQIAFAELLNSGEIKKHIRRCQQLYTARRSLFATLIHDTLGNYITFEQSSHGLAFWLQLHPAINVAQLNNDLLHENLQVLAGAQYATLNHMNVPGLRLGFADLNKDEMLSIIAQLKNVLCQQTLNLRKA